MEIPDRDPFAAPAYADEPGATAAPAVRTVTLVGPLAQRDPRAAADETGEIAITGATSFDDLLVRARRRGFLSGVAAGAVLAAAAAAVVTVALAPATPPPATIPPTPAATLPDPVPAPVGAARRPTPAAAQRTPASDASAAAVNAPGLDLRRADEREGSPEEARAAAEAAAATRVERTAAADVPEPAAARSLDDGEVAGALAARRDAIDACVAATDPDGALAGGRRFLLVLSVHPSGRVADARIDDSAVEGTALGRCLASVARDMSFGPFDGEPVEVELPLRLAAPE